MMFTTFADCKTLMNILEDTKKFEKAGTTESPLI